MRIIWSITSSQLSAQRRLLHHFISVLERCIQLMGFSTRSLVLNHKHVQLSRSSFSLRYTGESSGVSSQISAQRRTINPPHGILHPSQGYTTFHLRLREEPHTQLMGFLTPHRGTERSFFVSERNHTQLMGTPNSWAFSQVDLLSLCPGGCLTQL
jgi:hypothetical protein